MNFVERRWKNIILIIMPSIELYYFNVAGLGHSLRLLLAQGGEEFKDVRISKEDWEANKATYKAKFQFGLMPVLVIDGKQYAQSSAIARYLGKRYNLAGSDAEEDFEIDQNVAFLYDLVMKASAVRYEEDQEIKKKKLEDLLNNYFLAALSTLNDILKKNNGHLAANKLTWGDFLFAGIYTNVKQMIPDLDKKFPLFKQLADEVETLPKVKEFLKKSPKYQD